MDKEFINMQRDIMQTAKEYLIKFLPGTNEAIEAFRQGKNEVGVNICSYIEEGLVWLMEIVRLTKDVQPEEMSEESMKIKIDMLVDAYENEDYTLMGDILEFEIRPIVEKWDKIIKTVTDN